MKKLLGALPCSIPAVHASGPEADIPDGIITAESPNVADASRNA
jgi:hypothetical protein